tara:strand:+ start:344 stop:880 length:537 start_codon:yes stop_codon:yes gene_type:complete
MGKWSVTLRETIYVGGMDFENRQRADGDTIIEVLGAIQKKSQTIANRWSSPFAKVKHSGKYETRFDYRGCAGYLTMDQHNPAVLTFKGYWGGKAQSRNHVSPSISADLCFTGPIGHCISDMDCYHLLTYFYVNHFNVHYKQLPSGRIFYRESNASQKNDAEGMVFPPSFTIPPKKEVA